LLSSIFSVLGNDESKLIGTYEIGQFILVGRMSNNGVYTAVGTQKGVFLFENTGTLLWKDETGGATTLVITPDNKYLISGKGYNVYTLLKGQRIPKRDFDFSNYKAQRIEDKIYYDLFNEYGSLDYYYSSMKWDPKAGNQGSQLYLQSYDPLIIKDPKVGIRYVITSYDKTTKLDSYKLYQFDEVKEKNGMPPEVVARNSYPNYYRYNGKIYTHSLVKELDIPKEEKIKYNGIISKYFIVATDNNVYLFDINGDKKWFKDIKGIDSGFTTEYSQYIMLKRPYDIIILDQNGDIKFQYNFPDEIRSYGVRGNYISVGSKNGTMYFFDIKDIPKKSSTNTNTGVQDTVEITKEDTIMTPKEKIKEIELTPPSAQDTKNTPGFELPAILGGSLLAAYILNKKRG